MITKMRGTRRRNREREGQSFKVNVRAPVRRHRQWSCSFSFLSTSSFLPAVSSRRDRTTHATRHPLHCSLLFYLLSCPVATLWPIYMVCLLPLSELWIKDLFIASALTKHSRSTKTHLFTFSTVRRTNTYHTVLVICNFVWRI